LEIRLIAYQSQSYPETLALRYKVLREPLGLHFDPEKLKAESADYHLGAFRNGALIGCLVLSPLTGGQLKMRQMAIEPTYQGKGTGKALAGEAEDLARNQGYQTMVLHARYHAKGFYEKLGYRAEGKPFLEVTIRHIKMVKNLK